MTLNGFGRSLAALVLATGVGLGVGSSYTFASNRVFSQPEFQKSYNGSVVDAKSDINNYVNVSLEESIKNVGLSGGYYFVPEPSIYFSPKNEILGKPFDNERNIPIYLDKNGRYIPSKRDLEEAIGKAFGYAIMYNIPGFHECDEEEKPIPMSGCLVDFDTEKYNAEAHIGDGNVDLKVRLDTFVKSKEGELKFRDYISNTNSDLYDLWQVAKEITDVQSDSKEWIGDELIGKIASDNGVMLKNVSWTGEDSKTVLYNVVKGDEVFSFAHRFPNK